MNYSSAFVNTLEAFNQVFSVEWLRSALMLALFSTLVVVMVFAYLNRYGGKPYFGLWTVAWLFYALWLAVCIGLEETPQLPLLLMLRRACIGISALCMFWGSFELASLRRNRRELLLGVLLVVVWSYVAAFKVQEHLWITVPMFVLLALASIYTGALYLQKCRRHQGASLLTVGFILWGLHLAIFPVHPYLHPPWLVLGYFTSAALALFIAMGMVVFVLAEARVEHDSLLSEVQKGVATRRLLEQEVNVSEQKYRALFDSAGDAIFLVDLESFAILEANEKAEYFIGPRGTETATHSFLNLVPSLPYRSGSLLGNKRLLEELIKPGNEFPVTRHNGTQVLCEGGGNMVQYNRRPALQVTIREITERKELEKQLRQSEKLSGLGHLIAGVAHELNNPLAVIMGYAQMLAKQETGDAKAQGEIRKILQESERAAKIVRNILTFARPRDPQMMPVDFNQLLNGIIETYWAELGASGIGLRRSLDAKLPRTMADPHQMEQVITNLVTNAMQAMTKKEGQRILELSSQVRGNMIRLSVADTGSGIPADTIDKVFDPFYTTREVGKGTGLGLSICHTIVQEHGGKIWIESKVGEGTKVLIEIPILATVATEVPTPATAAVPAAEVREQRRILVVDDEPGIVEVLRAVLSEAGYIVESAGNGAQAIEHLKAQRFDLILSDLRMPDMDGEALYKAVRERNPKLAQRIVFVTGDTVSAAARSFLDSTGNRWLRKPFNIAEVEATVANFFREVPVPMA